MASLYSQASVITSLVLLLLLTHPPMTISQGASSASPTPSMTECAPRLLRLTPCVPFVQGMARLPLQSCCDNLGQVNLQQPDCLCLLLNDTNFTSSPVNNSRAMRLPALCNVQVNSSACSGFIGMASSPASQVPLGSHRISPSPQRSSNSTDGGSPISQNQGAPAPTSIGLGFGSSAGVKLKEQGSLVRLVNLVAFLVAKLMYLV